MAIAADDPVWEQTLDPNTDGLILESRARLQLRRFGDRDTWALAVMGLGLVAVAITLPLTLDWSGGPAPWVYALYILLYAAVAGVEFEVGTGIAVPTQLVFVPMLFVLPLPLVPLCVTAAFLLRQPPSSWRDGARLDRLLLILGTTWHTIGPVLVLTLALSPAERAPSWDHWPVYVAALAMQLTLDFVPASAREWVGLGIKPSERLPFVGWVYLIDVGLAPIGLMFAFAAFEHPFLVLLAVPLVALFRLFARERVQRIDHALELGQAYRGTAFLLGDVVEADDAYTGEHSRDVVNLTLEICDRLDLSPRARRDAEFVALLHDVGKIRIPGDIINKPGPLTLDERAIIETHTIEGEEMLTRVGGLLGDIGRLVRSCHERWDGTGYPDGLRGEEIPLISRIVCCADAFSAMTADRPYRKARQLDDAIAELSRCSGTQFDPRIVDALIASIPSLALAA